MATPLELVVTVPTEVPWISNVMVSLASGVSEASEFKVAVKVACPPVAVPETALKAVAAALTTRLPLAVLLGALKLLRLPKLATRLESVPTPLVVATPVSVATPLALVVALPTLVPSSEKSMTAPAAPPPVSLEVSVAESVAVPPYEAVPETLPNVVSAVLTTKLPDALTAAL